MEVAEPAAAQRMDSVGRRPVLRGEASILPHTPLFDRMILVDEVEWVVVHRQARHVLGRRRSDCGASSKAKRGLPRLIARSVNLSSYFNI